MCEKVKKNHHKMSYHGHARSLKTVTDICLLDEDAEVDMAAVISDLVAINKRDSEVVVVRRRCTMLCDATV